MSRPEAIYTVHKNRYHAADIFLMRLSRVRISSKQLDSHR